MIKLKIILNSKLFIIFLLFLALLSITNIKKISIINQKTNDFICVVKSISKSNTIINCDEDIEIDTIDLIKVGDIVRVKGNLEEFEQNRNFNLFNYKKYQNNRGIFYKLRIKDIEVIDKSNDVVLNLKRFIKERITNLKSHNYLEAFLLGDKSYIEEDKKDLYTKLGIIHIFSISGMHISIILDLINKTNKRKSIKKSIISYSILFIYYLLINSISLLRALIFLIIKDLNILLKINLSKIRIIIISVLLIIILRGYAVYEVGFYYSTFISITIYLCSFKINKIDNKILKSLYISFLAFLISLPLNIYLYSEINLLTVLNNLILIPIISLIVFPLSIITFLFPIFDDLFINVINLFEKVSLLLSNLNILIIFKKPGVITLAIYYVIIVLCLIKPKSFIILIIMLIIHYNINNIIQESYVLALDVGQGDSILIHNNNYNILIDTGGNINSNYNLSKNMTIKVLKSLGIRYIDVLVVSHGDYDHVGEAINLVNNFKVEKVIFNCGEYNELEQELIKVLDEKNIKHYSCINRINNLYFLQTKLYDNENDNSNIIYTKINGYKFLFMGDAEKDKEKDILDKYNISNIDVLKVGHHGSKTSSSEELINKTNPKYSIISVGKNNRYGHPNKEVLNNLDNSKIFRTDQDGSIMIYIKDNKLKIKTCI